jgi:probable HAF family extracellular repeat protein
MVKISTIGAGEGINAYGQVVVPEAVWTPTTPNGPTGSTSPINPPSGSKFTQTLAINSFGQVTGTLKHNDDTEEALLWTPTTANGTAGTTGGIGALSGPHANVRGFGINNQGQVVGTSDDVAFLWTPATPNGTTGTMIDLPGGVVSYAINNAGQVAGISDAGEAFLWTPNIPNGSTGSMIGLGAIDPGDATQPNGINSSGAVVGFDQPNSGHNYRAFLWRQSDGMLDLNTLTDASGAGWSLSFAEGINDAGQIVGRGAYDPDGPDGPDPLMLTGFLLTPVGLPEPSSSICILLSAVMVVRRRQSV